MSFILEEAQKGKNVFTEIVQYGLSLEKNPTFFKLKGNIEGNPQKVEDNIEKFPSTGGVQLYNPKDGDFDGKIKIEDSNKSMGIKIEYFLEFEGIIYLAVIKIRPNQSDKVSQVTVEIEKWHEFKNLNETKKEEFYPRLNEKFKEESDPIKDLGIGIPMKEQINIWFRENYPEYSYGYSAEYPFLGQLALAFASKDGKTEFVKYLLDEGTKHDFQDYYGFRHAAANGHTEIIKMLLDAGVDIYARNDYAIRAALRNGHEDIANLIRLKDHKNKQVYEKFSEEGDPIKDMGIGLEKQIEDYIKKSDHYNLITVESQAELIATADDLDNETKSDWLKYIFEKGEEQPDSWDIDAVNEMRNLASFVPYFELRDHHMKYSHKDDNYILYVDDWVTFVPYFNIKTNDEISADFIRDVLEGDAQGYFDTNYYTSVTDLNDQVNESEAQKIFNYLKPICVEISETAKNTKNLEELLSLIDEDGDLFEIEKSIMISLDVYTAGEQENEAYKELVGAIKERYEISDVNYDGGYRMKISKDGLNKLFADYYLADLSAYHYEDTGITYHPPRYGYMPDFNVDDFIEVLDGNL
jgi:hypothetical protein